PDRARNEKWETTETWAKPVRGAPSVGDPSLGQLEDTSGACMQKLPDADRRYRPAQGAGSRAGGKRGCQARISSSRRTTRTHSDAVKAEDIGFRLQLLTQRRSGRSECFRQIPGIGGAHADDLVSIGRSADGAEPRGIIPEDRPPGGVAGVARLNED